MSVIYKIISNGIYSILWPYGRIRAGMGNKLWLGRLGLIDSPKTCDVWLHAASVGETKVAGYLIDYLAEHRTDTSIYLSTMTTAGQKIAESIKFKKVSTGYFPIDNRSTIRRTLDIIKPRVLVIAETEIWPNLIEESFSRNIPIVLINGRMSERAFKKYKMISKTMSRLLSRYEMFFVKTQSDKEKLQFFGVPESKTIVSGDMKFDAPLLERSEGRRNEIRSRIGVNDDDYLFVAGSTRPGEETLLVQLCNSLSTSGKNIKLVIAPRHLNRVGDLKREFEERGTKFSVYGETAPDSSVILVEQMGLLNDLYLAADSAFVGGTLVNIGGHNILEPVWAGCPVLFGPFTSNVIEAKEYILQHKYGAMAANIDELIELVTNHMNGALSFQIKTNEEIEHSPTAVAGNFIIEKLNNA